MTGKYQSRFPSALAVAEPLSVFNQIPMAAERNDSAKGKLLVYLILYGWVDRNGREGARNDTSGTYTDVCPSLTLKIHCAHMQL